MDEIGGQYTKPMIIFPSMIIGFGMIGFAMFNELLSTSTNTDLISPPINKTFLDL